MLARRLSSPPPSASTPTSPSNSPLALLPNEVLDHLARTLPLPDRSRLGLVSRHLRAVCLRDALWEPVTKSWERTRPPARPDVSGGLHAFYCARRNQLAQSLHGALCLQTPLGPAVSQLSKSLIYPRSDVLIRVNVDVPTQQATSEVQTIVPHGPSPTCWKALPAELVRALRGCVVEGWGDHVVLLSDRFDRAVVFDADLQTSRFEMCVGFGQPIYHCEALGPDLFVLIDQSRRLVAYRKDGTRLREDSMQLDDVCLRSKVQRGRDGQLVFDEPVGKFTTIVDVEKGETHRLDLGNAVGVRDAVSRLRAFFAEHGYTAHEADTQINRLTHRCYGTPETLAMVCGQVILTISGLDHRMTRRLELYTFEREGIQQTYAVSPTWTKRYAHVGERYLMVPYGPHEVLTIDGETGSYNVLCFEQTLSDAPSAIAAVDERTAAVCMGDLAFIDLSTTPSRILGIARSGEITRVTDAGNYRIITNDANATQAQVWDLCEAPEDHDFPFWAFP